MNNGRSAIVLLLMQAIGSACAQSGPYLDFRPQQLLVNPATNTLYATNLFTSGSSSVETFDGSTLQHRTIRIDGTAQALALDPLANRIYVPVSGPNGHSVKLIDGGTGSILKEVPMPDFPSRVFVDSQGTRAYALMFANGVGIIDGDSLSSIVPVGGVDAALNPQTHKLYISSDLRVTVIDGATLKTSDVPLPFQPWLATNGILVNPVTNKTFVLADQGRALAVIDGVTNSLTTVPLPAIAHRNMAINTVTNKIYIANPVPEQLTIVDGTTYAITTVQLPWMPASVAVNEATNAIYVGQLYGSGVMILDGSSLAMFVVTTGPRPAALAIDATRNLVYVANVANVTVIDASRASPALAATIGMAVEYYHAGLDHFVLTSDATEIERVDSGIRWVRTGQTFGTFLTADNSTPVCRFYLPPPLGDSHLMMANPDECTATSVKYPSFILESPDIFLIGVPNMHSGACPTGLTPVYRLWNQRPDSNHRYTVDRSVRDAMVAIGYVAEGYGPDAVSMCAPSPPTYTLP